MYHSCSECGGLLRPHVVWFGEALDSVVMDRAQSVLRSCDLCLLVRTYQTLRVSFRSRIWSIIIIASAVV